jgi:hypothetical protein
MIQSLISAIAEMLLMAAWQAILKFFGWEQAAEVIGMLFGLGCMVIGLAMWWLGYWTPT